MASDLKFDVYGVRETLVELRKYERETYTRITNDLKSSAEPAARAVGSKFPNQPFRTKNNWHTTGGRKGESEMPPYVGSSARKGVKVVVSTRRPRGNNRHGLIRLQQRDAGGAVYESAGSATKAAKGDGASASQRFISNLDKQGNTKSKKGQTRSRVMYWATKESLPLIEKAIQVSIRKIDGEVQKRLNG
jgi:hypothetical protein